MSRTGTVEEPSKRTELIKLFKSLDLLISVHYSTNYLSKKIYFESIRPQLIQVNSRKIEIRDILELIKIWDESYTIFFTSNKNTCKDDYIIDIFLNNQIENEELNNEKRLNLFKDLIKREKAFIVKLDEFIKSHDINNIDTTSYKFIEYVEKIPITLVNNQIKIKSSKNLSKLMIKKDKDNFKFKEKIVSKITKPSPLKSLPSTASSSMTLLERIKQRELNNKANKLDPIVRANLKRNNYLMDKMVSIYNILFEISPKLNGTINHPIKKLSTLIRDSLKMPLNESDIMDILRMICNKDDNNNNIPIKLIKIGEVEIIKIGVLNRVQDLKELEKIKSLKQRNL
ncbi:unnamed protein product [[Candida] boidinii]|uniref:Unnamed protein product n=1 Tax=Candida boidinii TaxID=5477 RepID=A0A9W6T3A9_CANBO|nr:unnamed protein product [[Candida] boidinii]